MNLCPLRLALPAALVLTLAAAGARGGERFDPAVRDMLLRASSGEEPTAGDRRTARRALRDWELSERYAAPGDRRVGRFLRDIADGRAPDPRFQALAGGLHRRYLTPEGRGRRLREGFGAGGVRHPAPRAAEAPEADPAQTAQYWFLFATCLAILVGGLVVWALGRKLRQPDQRIYYS